MSFYKVIPRTIDYYFKNNDIDINVDIESGTLSYRGISVIVEEDIYDARIYLLITIQKFCAAANIVNVREHEIGDEQSSGCIYLDDRMYTYYYDMKTEEYKLLCEAYKKHFKILKRVMAIVSRDIIWNRIVQCLCTVINSPYLTMEICNTGNIIMCYKNNDIDYNTNYWHTYNLPQIFSQIELLDIVAHNFYYEYNKKTYTISIGDHKINIEFDGYNCNELLQDEKLFKYRLPVKVARSDSFDPFS